MQWKRALDVPFQLCWPVSNPELLGAGLGWSPDHSRSSIVPGELSLVPERRRERSMPPVSTVSPGTSSPEVALTKGCSEEEKLQPPASSTHGAFSGARETQEAAASSGEVVFLCTGEHSFPYRFCKAEGRFRCCFSIIIASLSKIHFSCERAFGGSESPWRSSVLPVEKPQICRSLKITVLSAGSSFFDSQCPPLQRKCS